MATEKKRAKGWLVAVDKLTSQQLEELNNDKVYQYTAYQETNSLVYVLLYYQSIKTYPSGVWSGHVWEPITHFAKYVEANVEPSEWKEFGTRPEYGSRRRIMNKNHIGESIAAELYTRFADLRETIDDLDHLVTDLQHCQRELVEEAMEIYITGKMDVESYAKELERIAYAMATDGSIDIPEEFSDYAKRLRANNRKRTEAEKTAAGSYTHKGSETKEEEIFHRMMVEGE